MKAVLVLAVFFVIANSAPHGATEEHQHEGHEGHHGDHIDEHGRHRPHNGSVCNLSERSLAAVVECVVRNVTEEIRGKLERVKEGLHCDTILCGIKKTCDRDGTLENNRTDVFTHEQNGQLRVAFMGCRPQPMATSEESVQHATAEA
uniref:Putative microplusin-like 1 protein n=1 Tax=Rhipicephalus microplus TaxID=6941 RepID=A0A6G5A5S7_RHIMP